MLIEHRGEEFLNSDQLIVRIGKACNFNCVFCNVWEEYAGLEMRETVEDIVKKFHSQFKYANIASGRLVVTISWWEPSIFQKETLFALKYISSFLKKSNIKPLFEIQTNASNIDQNFAIKLRNAGVTIALVSFHSHEKESFERIFRVPYEREFQRMIRGVYNLHEAWIEVQTNTVLTNYSKNTFAQTIGYILSEFPFVQELSIWIVQLHGEAKKDVQVYPLYGEVEKEYNRAISLIKQAGKEASSHSLWLPICYMEDPLVSMDTQENLLSRSKILTRKSWTHQNTDAQKIHTWECDSCSYRNVCSGLQAEYVWIQKLRPIVRMKDFSDTSSGNIFAYKLRNKEENLREISDRNVRQIIISDSLWKPDEILELIWEAVRKHFYEISLVIGKHTKLSEAVIESGITNIQIDIEELEMVFLDHLIAFSSTHTKELRVDIDVFVKRYCPENFSKLQEILVRLPNKYVKLYFIQRSEGDGMREYETLLKTIDTNNRSIFAVNLFNELSVKQLWEKH